MRTTKLTETQEAVEAEVSFPTSCAQAKFSFEKGSDNCTVRVCSSGDAAWPDRSGLLRVGLLYYYTSSKVIPNIRVVNSIPKPHRNP